MNIKSVVTDLNCALGLERRIVGVKFIFSEAEYRENRATEVKFKLSYCNMVKQATQGKSVKACIDNFLCVGSAKALGLIKPDENALSGNLYYSFGLYDSLETSKKTQDQVTFLNHQVYGVMVMPLEEIVVDPDIVIFIANPYQSMRIIQGYAYHHGAAKNIKMVSNSGICSECTATPYAANDLNVSLLCSNTRFAAKWHDHELGVGLPFSMLESVHEGILKTIEPCEPYDRKIMIQERYRKLGIMSDIRMDTTYFLSAPNKERKHSK